jgi:hypothetical protein
MPQVLSLPYLLKVIASTNSILRPAGGEALQKVAKTTEAAVPPLMELLEASLDYYNGGQQRQRTNDFGSTLPRPIAYDEFRPVAQGRGERCSASYRPRSFRALETSNERVMVVAKSRSHPVPKIRGEDGGELSSVCVKRVVARVHSHGLPDERAA